jgi:hypothetical protein
VSPVKYELDIYIPEDDILHIFTGFLLWNVDLIPRGCPYISAECYGALIELGFVTYKKINFLP